MQGPKHLFFNLFELKTISLDWLKTEMPVGCSLDKSINVVWENILKKPPKTQTLF